MNNHTKNLATKKNLDRTINSPLGRGVLWTGWVSIACANGQPTPLPLPGGEWLSLGGFRFRGLSIFLAIAGLGFIANAALALPWVERLEGGSAAIQNAGDTSYRSATVGTEIGLDEAVLPSPRTRMVVRCPNNTRSRVVPGRISGIGLICPDLGITRRSRGEDDVLALHRGDFSYELRVLDELPLLAWPELSTDRESQSALSSPFEGEVPQAEGLRALALTFENPLSVPLPKGDTSARSKANNYQASLYQVDQETLKQIWQAETATTSVAYDGPPLETGITYSLIVEPMAADTLCGEGDTGLVRWRRGNCFRVNFQRLGTTREIALAKDLTAVEAGALDPETSNLALAYAHKEAGLHQEVIRLVAPLVAAEEQPAAVHELLADGYLQAGWIDQAQAAFEEAERLATRDGDFQTRLAARLGLVKVAAWRMQSEVAVDYLWAALRDVSYGQDREQADVILQWIRKLE